MLRALRGVIGTRRAAWHARLVILRRARSQFFGAPTIVMVPPSPRARTAPDDPERPHVPLTSGGPGGGTGRPRGLESRCMGEAASKILQQALALPEDDRVTLATELLASLEGAPDQGWDEAWLAELDRRARAAETRGTPAPEWSEVRARILSRLGQR